MRSGPHTHQLSFSLFSHTLSHQLDLLVGFAALAKVGQLQQGATPARERLWERGEGVGWDG